jgi:hypothetical protein
MPRFRDSVGVFLFDLNTKSILRYIKITMNYTNFHKLIRANSCNSWQEIKKALDKFERFWYIKV